jgi:acetyltransferase EpsM
MTSSNLRKAWYKGAMPETAVIIPMLNTNEPDAVLRTLFVREGQRVSTGEPLCTLETTKSTADLEASADGYVVGLRFQAGQLVPAGEILCYLAPSPDWKPPAPDHTPPADDHSALPQGLRITEPALGLARMQGLDLESLPTGVLVTENVVKAALQKPGGVELSPALSELDPTAIIIYGGGGHGKALIELIRSLGNFQITGVVDDILSSGESILGVPVLGGGETLPKLYKQGVRLAANAVGGISRLSDRFRVFQRLAEAGFACPALVHPKAFVEASARLSPGVQVMPQAYVGSEAKIGFGAIVNTGAIISHDCILEDYVNLSPGAILAGNVHLGRGVLIGMGVTVNLSASVGAGTRVGNGATIKADVPENSVVRAGSIWPE